MIHSGGWAGKWFGLMLAGVLLGCAATPKPRELPGPVIVLTPPQPTRARMPPDAVASSRAALVLRDTAALQRQATRYVARRDSRPEVTDHLTTLTLQARQSIERMQRGRAHAAYRPADVVAARVAADALAAFLQTQASP